MENSRRSLLLCRPLLPSETIAGTEVEVEEHDSSVGRKPEIGKFISSSRPDCIRLTWASPPTSRDGKRELFFSSFLLFIVLDGCFLSNLALSQFFNEKLFD